MHSVKDVGIFDYHPAIVYKIRNLTELISIDELNLASSWSFCPFNSPACQMLVWTVDHVCSELLSSPTEAVERSLSEHPENRTAETREKRVGVLSSYISTFNYRP